MSLRAKLILVLLIALALPVSVSLWHLLGNFNQVQRATQRNLLQRQVDATFNLLVGIQHDAQFNVRLMAGSAELDRYLKRTQYRLPEMTTYRALLKSWSIYLKHYSAYRRIGYVASTGVTQVEFALDPAIDPFELVSETAFLQAAARNQDQIVWYRPARQPNVLSYYVAYGVSPLNAGNVVRRSNQIFEGYMVIQVDFDTRLLSAIETDIEDDQVTELLLQDQTQVSSAPGHEELFVPGYRFLQVRRALDEQLTIRSGAPFHAMGWLDTVVLQAAVFSLLQFLVAALIVYLIVNRWLVQPLQHTLALTRQLRQGQWLGQNHFRRRDEMGRLIRSLHIMSDRLRDTSFELDHKRLQAEQAERLKTEFLANVSHEIRTPVNIIVGVMNRLARFVVDPRQKEYLDSAIGEAHKLVHQIDDLILLADLEAHKHSLIEADFFIPDLIQHVTAPFLKQIAEKGLEFNARIDAELNEVLQGDSQKLIKVLQVLLDNAVKFTTHGGIELTARLLQQRTDTVLCEFAVQDTGPGIDTELLPNLGKAFAQGDGSLQRSHGGLGMGLSIANGMLALMDSRIQVQSTTGNGSRLFFTVVLQRTLLMAVADNFSI